MKKNLLSEIASQETLGDINTGVPLSHEHNDGYDVFCYLEKLEDYHGNTDIKNICEKHLSN